MSKIVYVVTLDGEPYRVYSDPRQVFHMCQGWFQMNQNDYKVEQDFGWWVEDRNEYPNTDEGYEQAWTDYIEEQYENGTWGDYAWYEVLMD